MASYNAWNHIPTTVNPVLRNVAIQQWGADGIISSDATAVEQLVDNHKVLQRPANSAGGHHQRRDQSDPDVRSQSEWKGSRRSPGTLAHGS
jgi:hypothetical protein